MVENDVKIDLSKIVSNHGLAAKDNAVEANKLTVIISTTLFTVSVFFIGFIASATKIIEKSSTLTLVLIILSLIAGVASLLFGIFALLNNRLLLIKSMNWHSGYSRKVQDWILKNKKNFVDEIPAELGNDFETGDQKAKRYGKWQAILLFCQVLVGVSVFIVSIADMKITEKILPENFLPVQLLGLLLIFIGNLFVSDAVTRFDAKKSWRWKYGNIIQIMGLILSLFSIFLQSYR